MANKTVSAESGSTLQTIRNLWPYMWPADRPDLKMRVIYATIYLVLAKLVLMLVPYGFKWVTNALDGQLDAPDWIAAALLGPGMLVVAYNVFRVAQAGLNQLRDALFASVGQHAVRQLAAELGPRHIRVNAISAGPVATLSARGISGFSDMAKHHRELAPLGRNIQPREVGDTGLFLASDLASGITGEIMYVDGGYNIMAI